MADSRGASDAEKPKRKVLPSALVVLGLASFALGAVVWLDTGAPGSSKVEKTSTTLVTKPADAAASGTTTTEVRSLDTTSPGTSSIRSEAVAATLFGLGAILMLCGAFFPRISKVSLPGGGGFELLAPPDQARVVERTAQAAKQQGLELEPERLAALYRTAIEELLMRRRSSMYPPTSDWPDGVSSWGGPAGASSWGTRATSPGDDVIDEAVAAAVERVRP